LSAIDSRGRNTYAYSTQAQVWAEKKDLSLDYDLAPDGMRFAVIEAGPTDETNHSQLTFLFNFFDEVRPCIVCFDPFGIGKPDSGFFSNELEDLLIEKCTCRKPELINFVETCQSARNERFRFAI